MISDSTRSFFPSLRSALSAGVAVAALMTATLAVQAQAPADAAPAADTTAPAASADLSNQPAAKSRKQDKVVASKDTKKEDKKYKKDNPLIGVEEKLPDKELYDKSMDAMKRGHFDVARLDLQTLLNTYPDSQFQMRAKLAIADSWYKEGGAAALTQAEQEYRDFIVFYPNQPEAAEAQMRIGDIYFREMDKPDRDNSKALSAEREYRTMLQQFPDSPRIPEAAQRLREVQESLASEEADVASFYASRGNWPAAIARYETVADTYPLYSHMDEVLIGLGDAYENEAKYYRSLKLPEATKADLVRLYDEQAAAAYRKCVLQYSATSHVEDARDRLSAMHLPIPTPTPEQAAASEALENSRGQYTLSKRAVALLFHRPDTVQASTIGDPPLVDAKRTIAPDVMRSNIEAVTAALNPNAAKPVPAPAAAPAPEAAAEQPAPAAAPAAPASSAPIALQDVPAAGSGAPVTDAATETAPASSGSGTGNGIGAEIVQPSSNAPAPPAAAPTAPPQFPGTNAETTGSAAPQSAPTTTGLTDPAQPGPANNYGVGPVGPQATAPLAPVEKAPDAPAAINEVPAGSQPPTQAAPAGKKNPKPAFDKSDESSSTHKKKKGLGKLNPF